MANVLVIGASRGIGFEFVRQYRAAGDRVIATARDDASLARLDALGADLKRLDVARTESTAALEWQIEGEKFDIALYVAGVYSEGDAHVPPSREAFDAVMHPNVLGAMQIIPSVAPRVEAARGKFIFITSALGSIAGTTASSNWVYRASKAALNMAVRAAQSDYPLAVLTVMSPGWVRTEMGGGSAPLSASESVSAMRATIARLGATANGAFLTRDGSPIAW